MDFRISEDRAGLVEGVRDYLAGVHGVERLRALDLSDSRRSDELRQGLTEMGLRGLLVPEAQGGLGLSLVDAALIAIELGRAGVAEPLADAAFVAAPLLMAAGGQEALLGAIATGEAQVALQHPVNGWVADLDGATHLLADRDGRLLLGAAPAEVEPLDSVDPLRRLFAPVAAEGSDIGTASALLDHAALFAAAQGVGLAEAMLAQATDYAKLRTQFGQPIGAFQAVKHHLASAAVAVEFARPVVLRAALALEQRLASAPVHVSHAKIAAGDLAWSVGEVAIQIHGAMGYTYEVDLHFWMKRAWALAGAWGDRAFHLARVDAAVIGGTLPIGPAHSFD
ncbi:MULTISPECIES: acyl-CoA dehydrogenase family protein [unclassified Sphingomonas]|uniref:acyl-CoA dehydrogenase family protein n=1 Tax=unclassified Sphingomonas TaxID=196159 RepID=UPI0006F31A4B|nr:MULTISPECIES: acyl-CoA dehydrogenase [unclassified Sphingomonas]KQX17621.1 acyl-CoA dehydrogenase [Sphingomonas sp. Root1294]KQY70547.1 acyl-CoA dehydrogenase [Sphingomonas sp. Root50]KRB91966.1 acyl-CoA dehydrogenase [Sphingomonas sp. Root720]